jgi:hypothetical protein
LFWSKFSDLIAGFNSFFLHSGSLAVLSPDNLEEEKAYLRILALLLLAFGTMWYRILKKKSRTRESISVTTLAAGTFLLATTLFLMVMPYRIVFHSNGEAVEYQSQSCYLVGRKGNEARLFCPQQAPWNRVVNLTDPALKRTGTIEKIFSNVR